MIRIGHIASILCAVIFLLLPGCQRKDRQSRPTDTDDDIICLVLYQESESFVNALKFIKVPEDRLETSLSSVGNRGEPASQSQLLFANKAIKYKNRVILRKEQISSTDELKRLQLEEEN